MENLLKYREVAVAARQIYRTPMRTAPNLFASIPPSLPNELIEPLLRTAGFRIERIVSRGHRSPEGFWYDQQSDEWVLLVSGLARLQFEGDEPIELRAGSFLNIPAHQRHRIDWTDPDQPTIWLAIHSTPANKE